MDVYKLINSKDISEHCRKVKHKFNTEELAVLIFRNRRMSIDEKIIAYKELIEEYLDMEVIERINCKHYDSVKDMIKQEIIRLENLVKELKEEEQNVIYTYIPFYKSNREYRGHEFNNTYKTFTETYNAVNKEIKEDDDISMYTIKKKSLILDKPKIISEYIVDDNNISKMINIYDSENNWLDIDNICLNIPTPFKKGDILISYSNTPFCNGNILPPHKGYPFVLEWLCTWRENFQELLDRGNFDSSDMQGLGYYISNEDTPYKEGMIYLENNHDYDSWEYFDGELKGMERILKGVSSLLKDEIDIMLFIHAYEAIKMKSDSKTCLNYFTEEGLELAGFSKEDIEEIKKN